MRGHDGSVSEPGSPSDLGPDGKHRTPSWFWDEFSRQEAEEKLRNLPDGSFLVRNSSTPGTYTLTVRQDGKSKHLRIFSQDGMYGLKQDECKFESLSALVKYYTKHSLAEFSRKVTTHLLHPVRKAQVTKVNIEDALYILAEKGRQLNKDKEKYIELFQKQENANNTLLLAQMEAQALDNVRSIYEEFLNFPEQTDDVQEDIDKLDDENKKILRENGELAMRRHMTYVKEANEAVEKVKKQEEIQQQSVHDITSYYSVLMDVEEQCGNIKEQLLACCVKPELLDCLLVESVPEWPQSSWLVNCSREAAEATLADMDVGSFLLRKRDDPKVPYALSIVCRGEDDSQEAKPLETKPPVVKHCVIYHPPEKGYGFRADCAVFESIDELVSKHAQTTMKVYFSHMDTCLLHPAFLEKPAK